MPIAGDKLSRAILRSRSLPRRVAAPTATEVELCAANPLRWALLIAIGNSTQCRIWPDTGITGQLDAIYVVSTTTALGSFTTWVHGPWLASRLMAFVQNATTIVVVESVFQQEDYASIIGHEPMPLGTPAALGGPTECRIPGAHIPMPSGRDPTRRRNDP